MFSKKILLSITVLGFVWASLANAAPTKLRVVGSWSHLSNYKVYETPFWKESFKKDFPKTKVRLSSIDQMKLLGASSFRQLSKGLFDVVSTVGSYVLSDSPALAGLDLPAITTNVEEARASIKAYSETLDKILQRDFNSKLLAVIPYGPQVFFCKDKITSLANVKGKKIRAAGWTTSVFLEALGGSGLTVNYSEIAQSIQRGVLDCGLSSAIAAYGSGWGEVAKYLYPMPAGGWSYVVTAMNMDTWKKFSKAEQKKLISSIQANLTDKAWAGNKEETDKAIACLTNGACPDGKNAGMIITKVKESDKALAKKILKNTVIPAWEEKASAADVKAWKASMGVATGVIK